jgi:hypothetical protein
MESKDATLVNSAKRFFGLMQQVSIHGQAVSQE